jgi:hypothetical protein
LRDEKFEDLGSIHHGRKKIQPSRGELRDFSRRAESLLNFELIWFDSAKRQTVVDALCALMASLGYTVYACAILRNHMHAVIRRHRDNHLTMWDEFAQASREAIRSFSDVDADHPVWSDRPYCTFLYNPANIRRSIDYVNDNFAKHKLPLEIYPFIKRYDGFPYTERRLK